jgi:hypothetical protein
MRASIPILFLMGGEIVLALIGLRVALWVARGWRELRAQDRPKPPGGPGGGLRCLTGGRAPSEAAAPARPLRAAA